MVDKPTGRGGHGGNGRIPPLCRALHSLYHQSGIASRGGGGGREGAHSYVTIQVYSTVGNTARMQKHM